MFFLSPESLGLQSPCVLLFWYPNEVSIFAKPSKRTFIKSHREREGGTCVCCGICICDNVLCVFIRLLVGRDLRLQRSGCLGQ